MTAAKKYGYLWVTLGLFLFSLIGHWIAAWFAYVQEQSSLGLPAETQEYVIQTLRDTLENWQSEFLQLIWQVAGLSFLWFVGSPQSKEGNERVEKKLDRILTHLEKNHARQIIEDLESAYPKK